MVEAFFQWFDVASEMGEMPKAGDSEVLVIWGVDFPTDHGA